MEVAIIKIGNSKGIRLAKSILERYQIGDRVELVFESEQIIIRPVEAPRRGWDEAFKSAGVNEEDNLLIDDVFEDEEFEKWD